MQASHFPKPRTLGTVAALILALVGMIWLMREVIPTFAICLVLVYLLEPLVTKLSSQRVFGWPMSRGLAVGALYGVVLVVLGTVLTVMIPRFYAELFHMAHELPRQFDAVRQVHLPAWEGWVQGLSDHWGLGLNADKMVRDGLTNLMRSSEMEARTVTDTVRQLVASVLQTLMTTLFILIITALLMRDAPRIRLWLWSAVPTGARPDLSELVGVLSRDLNGAIRGQLIICLINGILTTIGLMVLGIHYAVTIGLIAGICSLIPVFGTVISTVPAVLIAVTQSWVTAAEVVGVVMLIHLIEANYLNPKVMGHTVELHPVVILGSLFIAEHYFGMIGLLVAVPSAAALRSLVRFTYDHYLSSPANPSEPLPSAELTSGHGELPAGPGSIALDPPFSPTL